MRKQNSKVIKTQLYLDPLVNGNVPIYLRKL